MTLQAFQTRVTDLLLLSLAALLFIAPANLGAAGISGNYIVGQWGSPILNGCVADAVDRSALSCSDTTSTAVYSIKNASLTGGPLAKSTMSQGGDLFPEPGDGPIIGSTVTFTGGTIPATHSTVPFVIGGIAFTNGSTYDNTQVYGATLSLFASDGFTAQFIGSEIVQFNETLNTGTAAQNADYLTFSGLAGQSFEVYEQATATGALNGEVVGDPVTVLTSLSLDPGQSGSAFIGADSPLPAATPEPATLALFGAGMLGLWVKARISRAANQSEEK